MAAGITALGMKEALHWSRGVLGASRLQCEKTATPSRVQGAAPPPGVQRVPLFLKTLEGSAGGIAAHAKPGLPRKEGAGQASPSALEGAGHNKTIRPGSATPLAKSEQLCYNIPMKSATGPPLFLGACRIHLALWANHRESPCGRGAEGTTQGARPSEEGWGRSECRGKAQALWSGMTPK